ncbi:MAG: hypothetical protein M9939_16565 [Mesorhizobium sp.]|nr:hypothetical protein [Mesorhizobium sp.]MCO5162749.1 hypothetical protein [Mesorhizobium sp.]
MNKPEREFSKAILTAPMSRQEIDAIQAVEGLYLSPRMRALFDQAEREGVDGDELDRRINAAFGIK